MRNTFALTLALAAAVSGCTSSDRTSADSTNSIQASEVASAKARAVDNASIRPAIASLPDRGELLRYTQPVSTTGQGKATAQPVAISEAHAFRAIQRKELVLNTPDGERLTVPYSRHQDHGDGNWTWFGRDANGASTVLTFGQDAVFGSVQRADGSELRITTQHRRTYAVVIRPDQFRGVETSTGTDYLVVPEGVAQDATRRGSAAQREAVGAVKQTAAAATAAANEVDVLLGYSNGLAARIGSAAGAETRLRNLIAVTNEAYQNSGVTYRVRLVGTLQVNYGDSTKNDATLESLTGSNGSGSVPVDPAFNALRAAREQTGADLVSFVRQFRDPEQDGCGIAWLLGGGQSTIDQSDAAFAYSVVSDGSDLNEGDNKTYFCRDETLAHELGHTMGQAHNTEDSSSSGAHAYSYGYREASTTGFFTVMAYRITDSSQVGIRYFANPNVLYSGRATGVANQSDNVRSMNQTMPIISAFRATVVASQRNARVDFDGDGKSELLWQYDNQVLYQVMNGAAPTSSVYAGVLGGSDYKLVATGDMNGDGRDDLVFDQERPWARYMVRWFSTGQGFSKNVIEYPRNNWVPIGAADFDGDGKSELIWQLGDQVLYQVVNGANVLSSTYAGRLGGSGFSLVAVGDFNGDGRDDLVFDQERPWARYMARWFSSGQGFVTNLTEYPRGNWVPVGAADLDGDRKSELVWQFDQQVLYQVVNGTSVLSSVYVGSLGGAGFKLVSTGDFNGDGKDDLVFDQEQPWARYMVRWISTNQGLTKSVTQYSQGNWIPPAQGLK